MENRIKENLKMKRDLEAESLFLHKRLEDRRFKPNPELEKRMNTVDDQLSNIESWLMLLAEDERHVIQRHLIDGIDIPRIVIEYRERWGEEYAKTERTIKSYQRKALQKIARFEKTKQELLGGAVMDDSQIQDMDFSCS